MVRLLQDALRKNPRVRAALLQVHPEAAARGKAVLVWNGDWVQSPGQEGKGLAGRARADHAGGGVRAQGLPRPTRCAAWC
jgi:erythromycin esterase-like protein